MLIVEMKLLICLFVCLFVYTMLIALQQQGVKFMFGIVGIPVVEVSFSSTIIHCVYT